MFKFIIKKLHKSYDVFQIETKDWNILQLMFGKHYMGLVLLALIWSLYFYFK